MFAVFRPRLGQGLQLQVCDFSAEAESPPFSDARIPFEVRLNGLQLGHAQGQSPGVAELEQGSVRYLEIDLLDVDFLV